MDILNLGELNQFEELSDGNVYFFDAPHEESRTVRMKLNPEAEATIVLHVADKDQDGKYYLRPETETFVAIIRKYTEINFRWAGVYAIQCLGAGVHLNTVDGTPAGYEALDNYSFTRPPARDERDPAIIEIERRVMRREAERDAQFYAMGQEIKADYARQLEAIAAAASAAPAGDEPKPVKPAKPTKAPSSDGDDKGGTKVDDKKSEPPAGGHSSGAEGGGE